MSDPSVTIRMYRVGLGDCHLLSFKTGNETRHILIDCGYFPGSGFAGLTTEQIVKDISAQTHHRLDAVVVTHEHQDHLQGFIDAQSIFRQMELSELWLGWTEKPGQKIVAEKRSLAGLEAAAAGLAFAGDDEQLGIASAIENMLGFSKGTDQAFETIKSWFPLTARKYWNPGDVFEPNWLPGVRIFVLGPQKDLNFLRKTTGKKNTEMYELSAEQLGFAAAAMDEAEPDLLSPFDGKYARESLSEELAASYNAEDQDWRRIDNDWLFSAARLALQLDSYTNNTSLVLAFELKESGRVLLFVGDAQIGSWLSWQSIEFEVANKKITAGDLLARTVYYKVGHHGSHNATLVEGGLLSMTNKKLHAAIPTNESWASKSKHWEMPNARLWTELQKRCVNPILRPDVSKPNDLSVEITL